MVLMEGGEICSDSTIPNASVGTLIGRIEGGNPFILGSSKTYTADIDGILQLGMNDCLWWSDNIGLVNTSIEIIH